MPPRQTSRSKAAEKAPSRVGGDAAVSTRLLTWYDQNRRHLPWRYAPGETADPYRVWLSEIMLQQTVVKAVVPFFEAFTSRWPTVTDLASAPLDDILAAWAGLGYYSRARNLHRAAQAVANEHDGRFPPDEALLRELPGVGPYTAAAIAAIGFGLPATPVDGNIERVVARLFAIDEPLPSSKPRLTELARALTPQQRAGDYAQAMMDLGATVCTPKSPSCLICPLAKGCKSRAVGNAASLPRKSPKAVRPTRYGIAFILRRPDGAVALRRRPPTGLLGGMHEVPSTPWTDTLAGHNASIAHRPIDAPFERIEAIVAHIFTHFRLELSVAMAEVPQSTQVPAPLFWAMPADLSRLALPTVMKKVLRAATR